MDFTKLYMEARQSTRTFTGETVSVEMVQELLRAAVRAPNACNFQSWYFYVVFQKDLTNLVPDVYRGEWILKAGVAIVVCTEDGKLADRFGERGRMYAIQDTAAAMTMLLLEAADLGLAGCWLGAFDPEACRKILSIPENRTPVAIAIVGRAQDKLPMRERKPLEEVYTVVGES